MQTITQRVISAVLLLGFVLVDLGSPTLEAVLFSTISGCFFLIASFLDDLANPFGGSWSCDPAKEELTRLEREGGSAEDIVKWVERIVLRNDEGLGPWNNHCE